MRPRQHGDQWDLTQDIMALGLSTELLAGYLAEPAHTANVSEGCVGGKDSRFFM